MSNISGITNGGGHVSVTTNGVRVNVKYPSNYAGTKYMDEKEHTVSRETANQFVALGIATLATNGNGRVETETPNGADATPYGAVPTEEVKPAKKK